ncbi:MAG TPA: hypothetical protein VNZ86_04575 [Bacteroidia bacterium]|jgi:hypothetical protein|nr:hypothetical protein [Bacteroidia bacterium]
MKGICLTLYCLLLLEVSCIAANPTYPFLWDLHAGQWQTDFGKLNQGLNQNGLASFSNTLNTIGISLSNHLAFMSGRSRAFMNLDYTYIVPTISARNGTVSSILSGYALGMALGKGLVRIKNYFGIKAFLGFQTGRMKLLWSDEALRINKAAYTNPFFSPQLTLIPRFIFGHFSFGGRFGYQYDISKGRWRHSDGNLNAIGNAYMTGWVCEGIIGYAI